MIQGKPTKISCVQRILSLKIGISRLFVKVMSVGLPTKVFQTAD